MKSSYNVDERALGGAAALLSFLLVAKIALLAWCMLYTTNRPLADLPVDGVLYLAGADLLLCFVVAAGFALLYRMDNALAARRALRVGMLLRALILVGIVIFSVASFEVCCASTAGRCTLAWYGRRMT